MQRHATGDVPSPRYAHAAVAAGTKLFVFGGTDGARHFDDIYVLDTGSFSRYV